MHIYNLLSMRRSARLDQARRRLPHFVAQQAMHFWCMFSLLAVPPALVLTTIVFTLVRLLGKK